MPRLESLTVSNHGVNLHVHRFARPGARALVMLHGMQDVALSLRPVAEHLAAHFDVWLPDLRGHGRSDRPGTYSLPALVFDLHALVTRHAGAEVCLLGHSLGGQIAARFAAMFPGCVRAAVIAEGLGPPASRPARDGAAALEAEGQRLVAAMTARTRPLPDAASAAARLCANNPRLDPARAAAIAAAATEPDESGQLRWAFDPRVRSVFVGPEDASRYWPHVRCPVLLVAGRHAHEYWERAMAGRDPENGQFAPGELEARRAQFRRAELVEFDGSGHMVHFDEPERLAETAAAFLTAHA